MFMLHMAILIFPTSLLTGMILGQGQGGAYLFNKLNTLVPLYGVTYFIIWSVQSDRGRRWRDFVERLLNAIPIASRTQRDLALARLCAALEALINAGVTIIEAWDIAARASGSQQIERAVAAARPRIVAGELPSDAISTQRVYPDLFITSYRTGEVSGQLDDALRRLYRLYMDQATTNLQRLAEWLPKIVYLIVALWIAYQIVAFYDNYFNKTLAPFLQ
jgi:type II secretory pathway component PulF